MDGSCMVASGWNGGWLGWLGGNMEISSSLNPLKSEFQSVSSSSGTKSIAVSFMGSSSSWFCWSVSTWTYLKRRRKEVSYQSLPNKVLKGIGLAGLVFCNMYCEWCFLCHVISSPSLHSGSDANMVRRVPARMPSKSKFSSSLRDIAKIGLVLFSCFQPFWVSTRPAIIGFPGIRLSIKSMTLARAWLVVCAVLASESKCWWYCFTSANSSGCNRCWNGLTLKMGDGSWPI